MKGIELLISATLFWSIPSFAQIVYGDDYDGSYVEGAENSYDERNAYDDSVREQYNSNDNVTFYNDRSDYDDDPQYKPHRSHQTKKIQSHSSYRSRLPAYLPNLVEKTIIVDPNVHAWGAYSSDGQLLRSGLASAGSKWCSDLGRPCRTRAGTFRIQSLGSSDCVSTRYPLGRGGAPMPFCMYFNGNQGLHGSYELAEANISHGCVRISVDDAEWIRYNFANIGTKVIIMSY